MTHIPTETVESIVEDYRNRGLNRRDFLTRLIATTGSMAAAHTLLETSGLAATVLSERESQQAKVSSATIEYPSENGIKVGGYLSMPQSAGSFPAVVVIHENRGLNEHTRDVARRFAAEGFVALAPDALSRKGGTAQMKSPDEARAAITALPAEAAIADLKAGLEYLNSLPQVQRGKLGSVGFCWGGARSFTLATASDLLRASVVFYGSTPPLEELSKVRCPVLGLYGETDERITSKVPETAEAMQKAGKSFEYKIYPGAGHAFFNDTGERYNAEAAKDAWNRTLAFLRITLK
ncbi:MAG: carboxymethylenebutenolidase [Abditibacteriota bacterium]|nr:carboxymethylenebutenolidase [Abditibacteriota bacterium]